MKCEECLPLIEEYVDGELDGRTATRLTQHLAACAACADELAAVRREQEVYAGYRRDLEVTPAHWNVVRARIEQEKDITPQAAQRTSTLREWLGGLFAKGLRPAFVAAVVLIIVAVTAFVIYQRSRRNQDEVAAQPQAQKEVRTPETAQKQATPAEKNESKGGGSETPPPAPLVARTVPKKRAVVLTRAPRPETQIVKRQTPDNGAQFEEAVAESSAGGVVRPRAPEAAGEFDFEVARHAGRAELLLRSFRNVRPTTTTARALDVSFEKEQARKLLYRNIALRRAATERGDPAASALLNTLEPILLDIANLPGRVRARDVQSIEQHMEKKEIVAALQVRTLLASN